GNDGAACELPAGCRRPHAHMIFGDSYRAILKRLERFRSVEPGRRDEAIDRSSDHVFEQGPAVRDTSYGVGARKAEEFALSGGHEARPQAIRGAVMACFVAMEEAVKKNLAARIRPLSKTPCKGRACNDRSVSPMIGNDQQRD